LAQPVIELPRPESLTREQRQRIISGRKVLEKFLEAVEDQEMTELLAGAEPINFKLVEGKSNRQWSDEDAAQKLLRNHLTAEQTNPPSTLISPAQAEKLLKGINLSSKFENKFATLITKPPGKPSLVPVSDKRPALMMNPSDGLVVLREAEDVI
jgi:DNA topoisomerase VI subunit B